MDEYNYFERLKESLEQAVAFENGDESKANISIREINTSKQNKKSPMHPSDEWFVGTNPAP